MKLIHDATDSVVDPGTVIHLASGPNQGQAWRFEKVVKHPTDGHRVHVTRSHSKIGRLHREYHPRLFGCSVQTASRWQRRLRAVERTAVTWAGAFTAAVIAWVVHEYGNAEWGGFLAMLGVHSGE